VPGDAQCAHLKVGEVEFGVLSDLDVGRHWGVQTVAGVAGNVMLERVGHLLAAHELCAGDDAPEIGARGMIAVLVGGEDVLDPSGIKADSFYCRPFALERQARVPLDENETVRRFDDARTAEIAFDAAAGKLPDAWDDWRGAGVREPLLGRLGNFLVQVDLPDAP